MNLAFLTDTQFAKGCVFLNTESIKAAEEKEVSNNSLISFSLARSRALQDTSGCFHGLSKTRFIPDVIAEWHGLKVTVAPALLRYKCEVGM